MSLWRALAAVAALLAAAVLVFGVSVRQLTGGWLAFSTHPEVMHQLELSLADQKRLAALDPAHTAGYRRRFAAAESLLDRLRILDYNREEIAGRYRGALLAVFGALAALGVAIFLAARAHHERRLGRLRAALARLAAGDAGIVLGRRRRDLLGRMAGMVEEASRTMARDRRRLASLENLAAWQEAARRHAHEMRTPLTAARLELARLERLLSGAADPADDGGSWGCEGRQLAASVHQELDRLTRFTAAFAAFGRLPRPRLQPGDLAAFAAEFASGFASAWPGLTLSALPPPARCLAAFDRDLLRQVLVNLCDNSALALAGVGGGGAGDAGGGDAEPGRAAPAGSLHGGPATATATATAPADGRRGKVSFALALQDGWVALAVADDGPGIPAAVLPRLFEPYATSRRVGEGMGLGLAISRKILLDHGGDLELAGSSPAGCTFRLLLPAAPAAAPAAASPAGEPP